MSQGRFGTGAAVLLAAVLLGVGSASGAEPVRIGVLAKRGAEQTLQRWAPTADYLSEAVAGRTFTIRALDFEAIVPAVRRGEVDFVLANPAIYVRLEKRFGASRIATLRNRVGDHALDRFGGVLFTRADRTGLESLDDLRGRRLAAVKENSLGGFLMAWGLLQRHGIDPRADFAELRFTGTHDAVVEAVLAGEVDAGTVRTETLERMVAEGVIAPDSYRVIHPNQRVDFPLALSTRLYPEWPLASTADTPERLANRVARALLAVSPESEAARKGAHAGWTVPRNYQPVHDLLRELRVPPYERRIGLAALWARYWHWLLIVVLGVVALAGGLGYVARLNARLRHSERALRHARDELEDRVAERTRELEAARREWNEAFEAISDPIFIHDRHLRIVEANPAFAEQAGLGRDQLPGRVYWEVLGLSGPLEACRDWPEQIRREGEEVTLPGGGVFASRSFAIRREGEPTGDAIHILEDMSVVRRSEAALRHRLSLEHVISELARQFVYARPRQDLDTVDAVLARMGELVDVDRIRLAIFRGGSTVVDLDYHWTAPGIRAPEASLDGWDLGQRLPWITRHLQAQEIIQFPSVDDLPEGASEARDLLEAQEVCSLLAVPLLFGDQLLGYLGFYAVNRVREWDPPDLQLLRTAGEIIANALKREEVEGEVRRSEATLNEAERIAHLGSWVWDIPREHLSWSDEVYRIFGLEPQEFGASYAAFLEYVHPDDREAVDAAVQRAVREDAPYDIDHRIVRPEGEERIVHERATVERTADGEARRMVGTVQDVTETRRAQQELESLNRTLRTLSLTNQELIHAEEEGDLLQRVADVLVEPGGYRMAWVGFAGPEPDKRVEPQAWAGEEADYLGEITVLWDGEDPRGQGPVGAAIRSGEPVAINDTRSDPRFAPWRQAAEARGYRAVIALPLTVEGEVIGSLNVYAAEPGTFGAQERALLEEMASDLAYGIASLRARAEREAAEQARLSSEAQQRELGERLQRALVATIQAIAVTIEKRDPYTAGHQQRVAELADALAAELGMDDDRREGLRLAATIHDIGKISIPAEILNRPGRLSETEFQLIKGHPQEGHEIVAGVEFPWPVADMVVQHHERLDGSGYPHGLAAEDIIWEARILAVADVVEAMASHRPYRPALPLATALDEIRAGRGAHYDAQVVDACLTLFEERGFTWEEA
jgi:phosphate/phosphite/phosphonate ABC transporter binding protein